MLGPLLRDDRLPGREFKHATLHEIAAMILGQQERMITLLNRQHAEYDPIAISQALTANTPVLIYTAVRKVYVRVMFLSASATGTIQLLRQHPTTGPQKWSTFIGLASAAGPLPVGEHEFPLPRDATLWLQCDQSITVDLTASVFDGEEAALIMNYEV